MPKYEALLLLILFDLPYSKFFAESGPYTTAILYHLLLVA